MMISLTRSGCFIFLARQVYVLSSVRPWATQVPLNLSFSVTSRIYFLIEAASTGIVDGIVSFSRYLAFETSPASEAPPCKLVMWAADGVKVLISSRAMRDCGFFTLLLSTELTTLPGKAALFLVSGVML